MMKRIILILTITAALSGCRTSQALLDERRAEISWEAFCDARGYDYDDNTSETTNEYLDTWCGSADEEEAFIAAGVEPY